MKIIRSCSCDVFMILSETCANNARVSVIFSIVQYTNIFIIDDSVILVSKSELKAMCDT